MTNDLVERIAAKAREWAGHYPQSSDGRNTFIMFAEWVEREATDALAALSGPVPLGVEELAGALIAPIIVWEDTHDVRTDYTVMFGHGYDFHGIDHRRQEAQGPDGRYMIWPNSGKWSIYGGPDGGMWFERFSSESEVKAYVAKYFARIILSSLDQHLAAPAAAKGKP